MKVSPSTFVSILDAALVAISDMRKKPIGAETGNFISLIFFENEIRIEYVSNTLCFSTTVPSSDVSVSATARFTRVVVHLKDLVNLLRCCCDYSNEDLEIEASEECIYLKSGPNFQAEILAVHESDLFVPNSASNNQPTQSSQVVRFLAESDLLFSAFHQFLVTPIPKKIVFSISSSGNIELNNTEEDRAEYPLSTYAEISRQFLSDFFGVTPIACAVLGSNLSPICSFLSAGGKCEVSISDNSWLIFRRKFLSNSDGELKVYVSAIDVVVGG